MKNFNDVRTITTSTSVSTSTQDLTGMVGWDASAVIVDSTPAALVFAYLSGNNFTATAHGFLVGLNVEVSNAGGGLPTGLSASTHYYIIVIDANTIAFATTQAHALAGTAITISGAGTGVQTVTPQALAGTLAVQKTNGNLQSGTTPTLALFTLTTPTTAASQNISATTLNYYDIQAMYPGMQFLLTVTSGQPTVTIYMNGKG